MPAQNVTVNAEFEANTATVKLAAAADGKYTVTLNTEDVVDASEGVAVTKGAAVPIKIDPAEGYELATVTVSGGTLTEEFNAETHKAKYEGTLTATGDVTITVTVTETTQSYVSFADGKIQAVSLYSGGADKTYKQLIEDKVTTTTTATDGGPHTYANNMLISAGADNHRLVVRVDGSSYNLDTQRVTLHANVTTTNTETVKIANHKYCLMKDNDVSKSAGDLSTLTFNIAGPRQSAMGDFPVQYDPNPSLDISQLLKDDSDKIIYLYIAAASSNGEKREHTWSNFSLTTDPLYTISTGNPANGTLSSNMQKACAGDTVTLTLSPNPGYEIDTVPTVTYGDGQTVNVTDTNAVDKYTFENKYTFEMPADNVTITANFKKRVGTPASLKIVYNDTGLESGTKIGEKTLFTAEEAIHLQGDPISAADLASYKTATFKKEIEESGTYNVYDTDTTDAAGKLNSEYTLEAAENTIYVKVNERPDTYQYFENFDDLATGTEWDKVETKQNASATVVDDNNWGGVADHYVTIGAGNKALAWYSANRAEEILKKNFAVDGSVKISFKLANNSENAKGRRVTAQFRDEKGNVLLTIYGEGSKTEGTQGIRYSIDGTTFKALETTGTDHTFHTLEISFDMTNKKISLSYDGTAKETTVDMYKGAGNDIELGTKVADIYYNNTNGVRGALMFDDFGIAQYTPDI